MNKREKSNIIKNIKKHDIAYYHKDIPEEYRNDIDIIMAEREAGIRVVGHKGFDVITQTFFVTESVINNKIGEKPSWADTKRVFGTFKEYYDYLNGQIYGGCYYQYDFSSIDYDVDIEILSKNISFINYDIDDYTLLPSKEELDKYLQRKKGKKQVKKWIDRFNASNTYDDFVNTVKAYEKSTTYSEDLIITAFFIWNYVFYDVNDDNRLKIIINYMKYNEHERGYFLKKLCHVYGPDRIKALYGLSGKTKTKRSKFNDILDKCLDSINNEQENILKRTPIVRFDTRSQYFYEIDEFGAVRCFETFDDLIEYRHGNLTNTDIIKAYDLDYDFSKCKVDETTILPVKESDQLKYVITKKYDDNQFIVMQQWFNDLGTCVKSFTHKFDHFFDFVRYLKGDLSDADLLFCDGLINLNDTTGLIFTGAKIRSDICDKLNIKYHKLEWKYEEPVEFPITIHNEEQSSSLLKEIDDPRDLIEKNSIGLLYDPSSTRVYYVTDIHILHKLRKNNVKRAEDIDYILQKIVNNIVGEARAYLLIGGDISSDYELFLRFINILKNTLNKNNRRVKVIFVLGNHELWDFESLEFKEIVEIYNKAITEAGMYLLQNDIIYRDYDRNMCRITEEEILSSDRPALRAKLRNATVTFFGGLAFSGYNEEFNAEKGIYRKTISREDEIKESKKFETLYGKILEAAQDKEMIILTHTPMNCWKKKVEYNPNHVYVSGHTHRNVFYDDGESRIYSDNQGGYSAEIPHLKWFEIRADYDYFFEYEDGIYEISREDYQRFFRGKNQMLTFNRKYKTLYMLKKKGYYCFIMLSEAGRLSLLNGGALVGLEQRGVEYYYDNMDKVIDTIKEPLGKYSEFQKKIAKAIIGIGGWGRIHGCIIDIDFYNHIYVNPVDLKLTAYWALDIIDKYIYPDIPSLLKSECPRLYAEYRKQIKDSSKDITALSKKAKGAIEILPQEYLSTDIYKASRQIKKMQKLESNILTTWIEICSINALPLLE